jgi:hypothetical protein
MTAGGGVGRPGARRAKRAGVPCGKASPAGHGVHRRFLRHGRTEFGHPARPPSLPPMRKVVSSIWRGGLLCRPTRSTTPRWAASPAGHGVHRRFFGSPEFRLEPFVDLDPLAVGQAVGLVAMPTTASSSASIASVMPDLRAAAWEAMQYPQPLVALLDRPHRGHARPPADGRSRRLIANTYAARR